MTVSGDPKYIWQGAPMLSLEQAADVRAMAAYQNESLSVVQRVYIEIGMDAVARGEVVPYGWKEGTPNRAARAAALAETRKRAAAQLERRRQSSRDYVPTRTRRRREESAARAQEEGAAAPLSEA